MKVAWTTAQISKIPKIPIAHPFQFKASWNLKP